MKPQTTLVKNKKVFTLSLLFICIFSIPFYQIRIPLLAHSLSITTVLWLFFSLSSTIFYFKRVLENLLSTHAILFFSLPALFIPSLLKSSSHGVGVYVEWILIPSIIGFFLFSLLRSKEISLQNITTPISILFFGTLAYVYYDYFSGALTYDNRLNSFFLSPNHLAMFFVPLAFIVASISLRIKNSHQKNSFVTITFIATIVILFLTQSLSSAIGLFCGIFILSLFLFRKKTILFFIIIFSAILAALLLQKIGALDNDFARNSLSSRFMIWETTAFLLQKSPLLGYSIDSFQEYYLANQIYYPPYLEWAVPTPHNTFLTLWFSGGIFVFYLFLLISAYTLYRGFSFVLKSKKPALFYCAGLIAIIFGGILDTTYWKNDLALIYWIIVAIILSSAFPHPKQEKE